MRPENLIWLMSTSRWFRRKSFQGFRRSISDQYTATSVRFAWVPAGTRVAGWHTTPVRQFVVWLTGWVEFETSDGERRRCEPGAVVLAEDTFGKGHISRHPDEGQYLMFVPVPNGLS